MRHDLIAASFHRGIKKESTVFVRFVVCCTFLFSFGSPATSQEISTYASEAAPPPWVEVAGAEKVQADPDGDYPLQYLIADRQTRALISPKQR